MLPAGSDGDAIGPRRNPPDPDVCTGGPALTPDNNTHRYDPGHPLRMGPHHGFIVLDKGFYMA